MLLEDLPILIPSPIQKIELTILSEKKIKLYFKRDDLIHDWISGNKWRKLKYNLQYALKNNLTTIITEGGAFSNHIYAVAGACQLLGLKSIGLIRGEIDHLNPTIQFCEKRNMELISLPRQIYKNKEDIKKYVEQLSKNNSALFIPEGGTNTLALKGVGEIWNELSIQNKANPDYIVMSCGTGGTTAGLLGNQINNSKIISFSALKSDHLRNEILELAEYKNENLLIVNTDYHFGGYAKWKSELHTL